MKSTDFFEAMPVTGISIKHGCAMVSFRHMKQSADSSARMFKLIADNNINLDMITQNMYDDKIAFSFSCPDEQADELAQNLAEDNTDNIVMDIRKGLSKLTLTGVGMATHTGVATSAFSVLAQNHIPYYQITTSEISISLTVDRGHAESAVKLLSELFEL